MSPSAQLLVRYTATDLAAKADMVVRTRWMNFVLSVTERATQQASSGFCGRVKNYQIVPLALCDQVQKLIMPGLAENLVLHLC